MFALVSGWACRRRSMASSAIARGVAAGFLVCAASAVSLGQNAGGQNEWTWMGGNSSVPGSGEGRPGVYGTIGTAAKDNAPGGRCVARGWVGKNGNLWLFGGLGFDAAGTQGFMNDLWEFDVSTNQWTWVSGGSTVPGGGKGNPGVYGTLQAPLPGNTPGGRDDAISWTDNQGNFWLFGGNGFDSAGVEGYLNDLWSFNSSKQEWVWMGGSNTVPGSQAGRAGIYGVFGNPGTGNIPGGRAGGVSWRDSSGNLWLFGGYGFDANGTPGNLNDLWRLSVSTGQWTWMGGSSTLPAPTDVVPGVYGTLGVPNSMNIPGGRYEAVSWTDGSGNFWLFGGEGSDAVGAYGSLNDLWEFQPSNNQWTWVGGSSTLAPLKQLIGSTSVDYWGQPGIYGILQIPGVGNVPGGLRDAVTWTDKNGNLWLSGGYGFDSAGVIGNLNDLWEYQISSGEWVWVSGIENLSQVSGCASGVYGTLQTPAGGNIPGGRFGAVSWTSINGGLWLMGGNGCDANGTWGSLNDIWEFEPATTSLPLAAAPTFLPAPGTYKTVQTISISDSAPGASISYSINEGAATTYTGPFSLSTPATIVAVARATGYASNSTSATYVIDLPVVATPTFNLSSGTYTTPQTVALYDATPGATIYYSTRGVPTTSSNVYTGPIIVASSETIKAIAAAEGYATSATAAADYVIWPSSSTLEWAWMGGSNLGGVAPVTGTPRTPAVGNIPRARYQAMTWTDKSGNFWLFGGDGGFAAGGVDLELNDLWEFNPSTKEWAWMAGSSGGGQAGVYGTKGMPSAQNTPSGREDPSGWTDSKGNLWLFGGYGLDASGAFGFLNDLWTFSPTSGEWTWMSGSNTASNCFLDGYGAKDCAQASTYGTLGVPADGNTPGSREGAITWTDNKGNLWLFGGRSFDVSSGVQYQFNELWEYDTSTNQWVWMGGSSTRNGSACDRNVNVWYSTCGEPGVYGTMGKAASGNIPGGRSDAASWTDRNGNFWLFSGIGFDSIGYIGDPQDLWEYNPSTNQWTWMGGSNALSPAYPCDSTYIGGACSGPSVFGVLGTAAAGNIPQGRDHAAAWNDSNGNLWLFGGGSEQVPNNIGNANGELNDLWEFNPSTNQWTLMGGSIQSLCGVYCSANTNAVYGALGTPAPGNNPGARFAPSGWTDNNGNFWLFGGEPPPVQGRYLFNNDLWEYQPSTGALPTTAMPTLSVPTGTYASAQSVTLSDATNGAFVYYTTDGTAPSVNSMVFVPSNSQPISIQHSETLKAIAVAPGCFPSLVVTGVYTLPPQAATPSFSLPAGTYTSFQTVVISDTTPGAVIYYTVDGSTPTASSNVYRGPIAVVNAYMSLQAIATASGYSPSNVAGVAYTLNLPYASAPTFSVASGTYNTPQTVTISDSTPEATVYYQINTGYPTTSSPVYSGPITVSSTEVIWAMATAPNYFESSYTSVTYEINPLAPQTAIPTFSVTSGTYTTSQTVTISDTTAGASIYYTTDGSTPSVSSTWYTGPIIVSSSETLQAIAVASGSTKSAVASASYVITLSAAATPTFSLASGAYTGSQTVTISDATRDATIYYTTNGTTPTTSSSVYSDAITVSASETIEALAVASGYANSSVASATYTINSPVPTFAFAASPTSITVNSGAQGATTLTVTPQNGFDSVVSFACSGLPSNATCSFTPTTVTPSGSAVSTQLTITVSAQASVLRPGSRPFLPETGLLVAACFFVWKRRRIQAGVLVAVLFLAGAGQLSGCGGGPGAGGGGGGSSPQSYSVSVTATSGTIQQKAALTLIEN